MSEIGERGSTPTRAARFQANVRDATIFTAVTAGWVSYDLCLLATSGEPHLVLDLLPSYLALLLAAAGVGLLCSISRPIFWALFTVIAVAAIAPKFHAPDVAWNLICLPRTLVLLLVGFLVARSLARRSRPAFWPGVGLGAIAAAVFATYLGPFTSLSACALVGALVLLGTAALRRPFVRRMTTTVSLLICVGLVAALARQNAQLRRPNQSYVATDARAAARPNLILIVLDTVSAHHLAPYGYSRVTTPSLDAFVRENAVQYTRTRSVSSWTLPSHASIFTGLYPSEHGATHPRLGANQGAPAASHDSSALTPAHPLRNDVTTLAERLSAVGYRTGAVVANAAYLAHEFGVDRGFEHYDDREGAQFRTFLLVQLAGFYMDVGKKKTRRAAVITDLGFDWIDASEEDRPFFLFMNYMDAHDPYIPQIPFNNAFGREQPSDPLNYSLPIRSLLYDRELRYLDAHVIRFIRGLEARALLADTVLVITSDHGEAFGEHGFWTHNATLYEELIRVPLYVKPAGPPRPGTSHRLLTSPDLYGLILSELGFPVKPTKDRSPMVAEWYQSEAVSEMKRYAPVPVDRDLLAWFDDGLKWIVSSNGDVEAYDLRVDPGELHPIGLDANRVERARARARAWWKDHPPVATAEHAASPPDPAVMERLRNLGYVR